MLGRAQGGRARRPRPGRGGVPRGRSGDSLRSAKARRRRAVGRRRSWRTVDGPARAILSAERVALNFLCHLSGIATATAALVAARRAHRARASATRARPRRACAPSRNTPCAAAAARTTASASTTRSSSRTTTSPSPAASSRRSARARAAAGHLVKIEVEVDTLDQLDEALAAGPDAVLLDNMTPAELREAVATRRRPRHHRSLRQRDAWRRSRPIAETGVDCISSGWITHSAPILDLALDVVVRAG